METKHSGGLTLDLRDPDIMGLLVRMPGADRKTALDSLLASLSSEGGNCFNSSIG